MKALKSLPEWARKAILIGGCILGVAVLITGILIAIRANSDPVNVFSVSEAKVDYRGIGQSETNGPVTADRIQSVYVSQTQIVQEIYVKEGDQVKVGDPLVSFDTTLTDIELQRQEIKVGQLELELEAALKEQKKVNAYRVGSPVHILPDDNGPFAKVGWFRTVDCNNFHVNPIDEVKDLGSFGSGIYDDPFIVLWDSDQPITPQFMAEVISYKDAIVPSSSEAFVVMESRSNNSLGGYVNDSYLCVVNDDGSIRIDDVPPSYNPHNPEEKPDNTVYVSSQDELDQLKQEAQDKVDKLELDLKNAKYKYATLEYELTNGVVLSKIDGMVKTVADAEEVSGTKDPVLVVSGGGGYFVSGVLSETELPFMHVGDTVSATSWESGKTFEAEITEISEYPVDSSNNQYYHYSDGNQNASLYRFTAALGDDASVREGETLNITYTPNEDSRHSFYIQGLFVRNENGVNFVYVKNEDGLLERRNITTGGVLYGTYIEVLSGLTEEDYVAFPYGKNVKDGAKTKECGIDVLYNY